MLTAIMLASSMALLARPGMAGQEAIAPRPSTLSDDLGALKRDVLLLLSVGFARTRMWSEARVVSQHLVDTADDPVDTCVAESALVWQTAREDAEPYSDATLKEWRKLRDTVNRVGADRSVTPEEQDVCRSSYRRVTGSLIYEGLRTTDLGRASYEKIRVMFVAYLDAVQQGVAADGALRRR
jgi:hypothetical protein